MQPDSSGDRNEQAETGQQKEQRAGFKLPLAVDILLSVLLGAVLAVISWELGYRPGEWP